MSKRQTDTVARFTVDGKTYEVDAARLTLGETADIESYFDAEFDELHKAQNTLALVYVAMRRSRPGTTWQDVEAIDWSQFQTEEAKRPTKAVPEAAGTQA